jgi:hypothetical protein
MHDKRMCGVLWPHFCVHHCIVHIACRCSLVTMAVSLADCSPRTARTSAQPVRTARCASGDLRLEPASTCSAPAQAVIRPK